MTETTRLNAFEAAPEAMAAMTDFETAVRQWEFEDRLLHLVRLRASQINGCAFCIAMHTREAREDGERQERLDLLQVWRETDLFDEREQAALGWTEAVTRIADTHAPAPAYEALKAAFEPAEQVALTLAIGAINTWNRVAIGFRAPPALDAQQARRAARSSA